MAPPKLRPIPQSLGVWGAAVAPKEGTCIFVEHPDLGRHRRDAMILAGGADCCQKCFPNALPAIVGPNADGMQMDHRVGKMECRLYQAYDFGMSIAGGRGSNFGNEHVVLGLSQQRLGVRRRKRTRPRRLEAPRQSRSVQRLDVSVEQ